MIVINLALPYVILLFLGMLVCLEIGRRVGVRRLAKDPQGAMSGIGVVEGAVFGLYGLLLAFTFSGAPARLDARRELVAAEVNEIGTAYLRVDLLPAQSQPAMRERFRRYLDSRIDLYRKYSDFESAKKGLFESSTLQKDIWTHAIADSQLPGAHPEAARLLLPSLNDMFDITTTRIMAGTLHPPPVIYGLMFLLALACSLQAGYSMAGGRRRSWMHIVTFALVTVLSVYTFIEIEYPRLGLIRLLDSSDQMLVDLREEL